MNEEAHTNSQRNNNGATTRRMKFVRYFLFLLVVLIVSIRHLLRVRYHDHMTGMVIEKSTSTNVGTKSSAQPRIAIVYKVKTINVNDSCPCERFVVLVEGTASSSSNDNNDIEYDVILLHERNQQISPVLVEWIQKSKHRNRVKILSNPDPASYVNGLENVRAADGFRKEPSGKISFLFWIHELHAEGKNEYAHYWFVEDDVFWTGRWGDFFRTTDRRLGTEVSTSPDYIANTKNRPIHGWWHSLTCRVNGNVCYDTQTETMNQTHNTLFRMSDRFVMYLVDLILRDALQGHDEATFIAALEQSSSFTNAELFANEAKDFKGLDALGRWSAWDGNTAKAVYSLRGLAAIYQCPDDDCIMFVDERMDQEAERAMQTTSNLNAPRNKIFHPVKCAADPTIGVAALAFATGEKRRESPNTSSLQSACRAG